MKNAPVFVIEDDADDKDFLQEIWQELNFENQLLFFTNGDELLNHLNVAKIPPFLILCDVNLPKIDGLELKGKIEAHTEINLKKIPFVFWSTVASKAQINKSYEVGGNGFFLKGNTLESIKDSLVNIMAYWRRCELPS